MRVATSDEMRAIDREAIERVGVPSLCLMENAGRAVAEQVVRLLGGSVKGRRIAVVCGRGNNGGDGMVAARFLHNWGAEVLVFLAGREGDLREEPATHWRALKGMGVATREVSEEGETPEVEAALRACDLAIDALLGTGATGEIKGLYAKLVGAINLSPKVVAVDLPTGVHADTGGLMGPCVKADVTVTFGLPKVGHLVFPGAGMCGKVVVADISLPTRMLTDEGRLPLFFLTPREARKLLPERKPDAHKGDAGRVLVVAGSVGLTGAAAMSAESAYRVGAGLVTLALPESLNDPMEAKLTEVMTLPLPERGRAISPEAVDKVLKFAEGVDVVALGPGLSRMEGAAEAARELVARLERALVLDADGINALEGRAELLDRRRAPTVVTPHPGEMSRLTGASIEEIQRDRVGFARRFAKGHGCVVVLKGARTVVASPDGRTAINLTGDEGMASGGTGDVLTGAIAGLLAQGLPPFEASVLGVYLHGLAGELASKELTIYGALATDVLRLLPEALRWVEEERTPPRWPIEVGHPLL